MMKDLSPLPHKAIILAGGSGSRLAPATSVVSKQLLPVYDKPMIYYPLCTVMGTGIRDILIITTPRDVAAFQELLADGSQWGVRLSYATQERPEGIAQSLLIGEAYLAGAPVCLMLGDNLFYGLDLSRITRRAAAHSENANLFACKVLQPQRYGVIQFGDHGEVVDIVEKPALPPSSYAVTGLYFLPADSPAMAQRLQFSARGELEITELHRLYLKQQRLTVEKLDRGIAWLDTGTPESLLDAAHFVRVIEQRQGIKIACPEELAYRMGTIDHSQLADLARNYANNDYGRYLKNLLPE